MAGKRLPGLYRRSEQFLGRSREAGVSLVVVVYNMPAQAERTIYSLTSRYQEGVCDDDYDVIVVENKSEHNLSPDFVEGLPGNFSYHLREETQPTPVHAANFGVRLSRRSHIALLIDGARMVTPGVVRNLLRGHRLHRETVVSVPGYHLGRQLQQRAVEHGYGVEEEARLLSEVDWPQDGYALFDIACFSGSCASGLFRAHSESNCISLPRHLWQELQGFDIRFNQVGGGLVNLDFYRRACELKGVEHVVLMGEGTFHQFHGGVTTGGVERAARAALIKKFQEEYRALRGRSYEPPQSEPVYLGEIPPQLMRFLRVSSQDAGAIDPVLSPGEGHKPVRYISEA